VRRVRDSLGRFLPGVLFALLVVALYADPVFFRRNFTGRDLGVYNLPMEEGVHDAYSRGRLPVWMPELSGGRPLLPNPNMGALYPVRPLLALVPFPVAMRVFPLLHWIAAGIGMIVLLRSIGASRAGSWVAAVTYVFSGVGVSEVFYPHIQPGMALLPWIVWALGRSGVSRTGKVLLLSGLFGLMFLAGDVFTSGIGVAACLIWILFETPRPERWSQVIELAAALALAALLAAPQIVATALWVPETNRAVLGMKLFESLFFSIHPLRLLELAIPFPFGACWSLENDTVWGWPVFHYKGMGVFTTLYAGAFAIVALVATRRERTKGLRFAQVFLLLALLVAVPPSLVPTSWEKLPSPLPLRNPEKFAVAIVLALAVVSGIAFDRLRAGGKRRRWPLAVAGLLTALALAAALRPGDAGRLAVAAVPHSRPVEVASQQVPRALTEAAFLWLLTAIALDAMGRRSAAALGLGLAALTAVPILANRKIARTLTETEVFAPSMLARKLDRMDPTGAYRMLGEANYLPPTKLAHAISGGDAVFPDNARRVWISPIHALWDRGTVFNNDFDVGDLSRLQTLRVMSLVAGAYSDSHPFFASVSLRWGTRFRDQKPLPGYRRMGGDVFMDWDVLDEAEPDIRLLRQWHEEPGGLAAMSTIPRLKSGEIVLETGRQARGSARAGIVHVRVKEPERLVVETVTTDPTWLFVLRGFWNHRTVRLDGREVEYVPAQLAFSAVPVPAGRHRIEWTERVPGGAASRWAPVGWALIAIALAARSRRKRGST
jgi:hypothetical protein